MTENERFGLVFPKTGFINSGTGLENEADAIAGFIPQSWTKNWASDSELKRSVTLVQKAPSPFTEN
jgi:hypothetical protein